MYNYGDYDYSSEILVNFKNSQFYPLILQQQFTVLDFVSYIGGALGLFLGFSVLSFFEILYYFSIRIVLSFKQNQKVESEVRVIDHKSSIIYQFCFDFFENSSIHGMNQIIMRKRFPIERILWFVLVGSSLIYCSFVTQNIYENYQNAPILLGYEDGSSLKGKVRKFKKDNCISLTFLFRSLFQQ
jgi:ABC-type Fe3+-siderophore transport system permease subunit